MNSRVKSVLALDDFELEVVFDNGERRKFDVKPYLGRDIFTRLRDWAVLGGVRVVTGSIECPGGLDLSYDTLYIESRPVSAATLDPSVEPILNACTYIRS